MPGHPDFRRRSSACSTLDGVCARRLGGRGAQAQTLVLCARCAPAHPDARREQGRPDRRRRLARAAAGRTRVAPEAVAPGRPTCRARRRTRGAARAYVDGTAVEEAEAWLALGAQTAAVRAPGVLRFRARRRRRRTDAWDRRAAARADRRSGSAARGNVFKIERGPDGQKIAYARLFAGTLRARVVWRREGDCVSVFDNGGAVQRHEARRRDREGVGAPGVRIGDRVGRRMRPARHRFAPPLLRRSWFRRRREAAAEARSSSCPEQDPLIGFRQTRRPDGWPCRSTARCRRRCPRRRSGGDYGVAVTFEETTPICVERPLGEGWAIRSSTRRRTRTATIGFRVEPLPDDSAGSR